jgi:serine/threonine protein phosphatase PrpC
LKALLKTAAGTVENQDCGAVLEWDRRWVVVLADGAGGRSGGREAAALLVALVRQGADQLLDVDACVKCLEDIDRRIAADPVAGETTAVLVVATPCRVFGASVGDSGAWLIEESAHTDLTRGQARRPFLGTGDALVIPFARNLAGPARLLLATDGLLKYAPAERITAVCQTPDLEAATSNLIGLVRYPSGALPDDTTVILGDLPA